LKRLFGRQAWKAWNGVFAAFCSQTAFIWLARLSFFAVRFYTSANTLYFSKKIK
jgi:hypothetical protein